MTLWLLIHFGLMTVRHFIEISLLVSPGRRGSLGKVDLLITMACFIKINLVKKQWIWTNENTEVSCTDPFPLLRVPLFELVKLVVYKYLPQVTPHFWERDHLDANDSNHKDSNHDYVQHNGLICDTHQKQDPAELTLSITTILIKCHYAECCVLFIVYPNFSNLSVTMLTIIMPSVICY